MHIHTQLYEGVAAHASATLLYNRYHRHWVRVSVPITKTNITDTITSY